VRVGVNRLIVGCCYVDRIYTGIPTTFVMPVIGGSDLLYNWTVSGPSHTLVEEAGSRLVVVFNKNASYVVSAAVWNSISRAAIHLDLVSHGVACSPPSVQLVGNSSGRFKLKSRQIRVETVVSTDCLDYPLQHNWSISRGTCINVKTNGSVSLPQLIQADTPTLFLPARTLAYGVYCVKFQSCFYEAPGCDNISVELEIKQSPLRAIIAGGDERSIVVSEVIVFDGSLSFDPDVDRETASFFTYNWACQVAFSTTFYGNCVTYRSTGSSGVGRGPSSPYKNAPMQQMYSKCNVKCTVCLCSSLVFVLHF